MIGRTLAHYEITELLGRGGMGEVYRARDTKLDRQVALKLLPEELARDPERLARFRREAKLLASLNHPNIAALHGIEESEGRVFLVMELADGEDLSEVIARGPLPEDELLRIAARIARGLEAAHERGIVHRDLKPSNIKLTADGEVKILDFGLARIYAGEESTAGDVEHSPTITAAFTAAGVILGTAAYMSPEQARGRPVDKRSDIWAFGVVLWEMATGERLFAGDTVSDTLAAVLTREVDPQKLPADAPPQLRHLVLRCLQRDPKRRLRDIGEARLMLEDPESSGLLPAETGIGEEYGAKRSLGARTLSLAPWVLLIAVLGLALPRLLGPRGDGSGELRVRRFHITADLPGLYNTRAVEISPDGTRIAVYAREGLWVRRLDELEPRLLIPSSQLDYNEGGITPFWSPDGESIGYGSSGRLWKVSADGGNPSVICTLPGGWNGGAWGKDGQIVFCTARGPMYHVSARGGDPEVLIPLTESVELDFHQPCWVSDGGGFVYSVHRAEGVDTVELYRDGERKVLLRIEEDLRGSVQLLNNPVYSASGHIVYQRDQGNRGLWALPFDAEKGEVTGGPFLILSEAGHPSVSRDGTLIYTGMTLAASGRLVVVSREGELTETLTESLQGLSSPAFSPDGRRIAFDALREQSGDIIVLDRDTRISTRLTLSSESERTPVWIPRSDRIAYVAPFQGVCSGIWAVAADGSGEPEFLVENGAEPAFSPDGQDLVCTTRCGKERGIILHRLGGSEEPRILREHPAGVQDAEFSPDGKFLSYTTWESGYPTVEVAEFPSMSGRRLVSRSESLLRWAEDGSEIYYIVQEPARMVAAHLEPGQGFAIESTEVLFELAPLGITSFSDFDARGNGSEFVLVQLDRDTSGTRGFTVVENWFEEFRED